MLARSISSDRSCHEQANEHAYIITSCTFSSLRLNASAIDGRNQKGEGHSDVF